MIISFHKEKQKAKNKEEKDEGKRKKSRKQNAKKCRGAGLRTCPQKGITLIALIITIIVMLILVGVTINVALNGGLFTQAQTATKETQKEAEREQLLSVAVAAVETDGKVNSTKVVLPSGFEKDETKTTNSKLVVKAKKSQITWQIDLNTTEVKEYEEIATSYTFTVKDVANIKDAETAIGPDGVEVLVQFDDFWTENILEELKIGTTIEDGKDTRDIYNIISNNGLEYNTTMEGENNTFMFFKLGEKIVLGVTVKGIQENDFENYSFTIQK